MLVTTAMIAVVEYKVYICKYEKRFMSWEEKEETIKVMTEAWDKQHKILSENNWHKLILS